MPVPVMMSVAVSGVATFSGDGVSGSAIVMKSVAVVAAMVAVAMPVVVVTSAGTAVVVMPAVDVRCGERGEGFFLPSFPPPSFLLSLVPALRGGGGGGGETWSAAN
jgi:hypothetical protein